MEICCGSGLTVGAAVGRVVVGTAVGVSVVGAGVGVLVVVVVVVVRVAVEDDVVVVLVVLVDARLAVVDEVVVVVVVVVRVAVVDDVVLVVVERDVTVSVGVLSPVSTSDWRVNVLASCVNPSTIEGPMVVFGCTVMVAYCGGCDVEKDASDSDHNRKQTR
eukprot:m.711584 g.711584  ORF g.711584 m.711584 type:complete len:161 (+) comp22953_c0_seq2:1072-1554(+)